MSGSLSLDGKAAVVTGAGRGLGRAYATALAAAGASVVVNDLDSDGAQETVALIEGAGGRAVAEIAAVGDTAVAEALVARAVSEFGRLDAMVTNAGVIFLGPFAPASAGDYIAGPSHVLPTFGTARFASVLGVEDFIRRVHTVRISEGGIGEIAGHVEVLAEAEGLAAHAESVRLRTGRPTWSAK